MNREQLIEDEFVRAKPEGIRLFSPGLLALARKLLVMRAVRADERDSVQEFGVSDPVVLAYLMDERNSLQRIREFADAGRQAGAPALIDYADQISMVFLRRCLLEVERTEKAVAALDYTIEAKPGAAPQVPLGK